MPTIPASIFVNTTPSVIAAGGAGLNLNGLVLTTSTRVPIGTVMSFSSEADVGLYFGLNSQEASIASVYFLAFDTSLIKPGAILFAQYPALPVVAYLRGGNISGLALSALQALSGSLTIIVDGTARVAPAINLSSATSFSSAAGLIQTGLNASPAVLASFTGSISGTTLTVSAVGSGTLAPGQVVIGAGVTALTEIFVQLTGAPGGTGTYAVSISQTIGSEAMTAQPFPVAVTYDSVSGAFIVFSGIGTTASTIAFATGTLSAPLLLTSATGAVLSQGANATTPGAFMTALTLVTQDWATFMTAFNPDVSGNANKLLFAQWVNTTNDRYMYVAWDTDPTAATSVPASASLGGLLQSLNLSGTCPGWEPSDLLLAPFVCGTVAAIDFDQVNGRLTLAYKSQTGLVPGVTDQQTAVNLGGNPQVNGDFGNGYNYYGAVATANQGFEFFQRGTVSGPFKWIDSYVNQIWFTNAAQLALMEFFSLVNSVPFNNDGSGQIQTALADLIQQGLTFGMYAGGVTLSSTEIVAVNASAGIKIDGVLASRGWFLLVRPATPAVRQNRGPWQITFFYVDQGSVQSIELSTVALQ